jgi:probable rRNA maturation factor
MLDLVFRNSTKDDEFKEAFFVSVLEKAIEAMNLGEKSVEISVNLVDEKEIQELNKKHRNKDSVTDVLSFPLEEEYMSSYNIVALGDIFICPSFAREKSIQEGKDLKNNFAWMTVHGFLHLMGYDHERSEDEEAKMFDLEQKILSQLNL